MKLKSMKKSLAKATGLLLATTFCFSAGITASAAGINEEMEGHQGKYYADYSNEKDVQAAARAVAEQLEAEGSVLLKNNRNTLPLKDAKRISVFGKSSVNPAYGGGGSGAGKTEGNFSLYDALHEQGYETNSVLEAFYSNNALTGTGRPNGKTTEINETPKEKYTEDITQSYHLYNDAAIILLARGGAEGSDLPLTPAENDEGKLVLEITQDEVDLINHVAENFDKVIVLLNSSNPLSVKELKNNDKIDSILWIGNPGEIGFKAVGDILSGKVNPSGKLNDTYVMDVKADPTFQNMATNAQFTEEIPAGVTIEDARGNAQTSIALNTVHTKKDANTYVKQGSTFVEYEEGIYVGYRYYETAAYEAAKGNYEGYVYDEAVGYTFGYGLSYTTFEWNLSRASLPTGSAINATNQNGEISFEVEVTNTGSVAGKDVVQLYYSAPYYENGIEKSIVNLGGFAKTPLLQPQESATVTVSMKIQDMSSFDYDDSNQNGFRGYELEAGEYTIYLGKDAHCWADANTLKVNYTVAENVTADKFTKAATNGNNGIVYTTDANTGNPVEVLFSNGDVYDTLNDHAKRTMTIMSRGDMKSTFPTHPTLETLTFTDEEYASYYTNGTGHNFSIEDDAGTTFAKAGEEHAPWYVENAPANWKQYGGDEASRPDPTYTFADLAGWSLDDEKWETVLNELTWDEMVHLVSIGAYNAADLPYLGKDWRYVHGDGPMILKPSCGGYSAGFVSGDTSFISCFYPCEPIVAATWNVELAAEQGRIVGNEALFANVAGWHAPAMNLHRNQFGGRLFEYYSEDPVLGGKITAAVIREAQNKGLNCNIKHFVLNNQDTGRGSLSVVVDEQAMRELYLRTFEIAVEEGGAHGIMTYYSFLGGVSLIHNYPLLVDLVRKQWGFEGIIMHDYGPEGITQAISNPSFRLRSGNGMAGNDSTYMAGYYDAKTNKVYYDVDSKGEKLATPVESPTHWAVMRQAAKEYLWYAANSNNQYNKLDLTQIKDQTIEFTQGTAKTASIAVNDQFGTANVKYEMVSGELPEGLTFNEDGSIGGTAQGYAGEYEIDVKVVADFWVEKTETVTVKALPIFTYSAEGAAQVGKEYYGAIETQETNAKYAIEGELPAGVTFDATTGEIVGTPKAGGIYKATVIATVEKASGRQTVTNTYKIPVEISVENEAVAGTVSISKVEEITVDGVKGYKVTFTDGTSIEVMNGAKGEKGDAGAAGPEGPQGEKGEKGEKGDTGANGSNGGCGSSVDVASAVVTLVALAGVLVALKVSRKSKKD